MIIMMMLKKLKSNSFSRLFSPIPYMETETCDHQEIKTVDYFISIRSSPSLPWRHNNPGMILLHCTALHKTSISALENPLPTSIQTKKKRVVIQYLWWIWIRVLKRGVWRHKQHVLLLDHKHLPQHNVLSSFILGKHHQKVHDIK